MTAYCFVDASGFSNRTSILGALLVGTASDGETYSLPFSCEYANKPTIPINANTQPSRFILVIALPLTFVIQVDLFLCRSNCDSSPPAVCGTQLGLLFHLQNHR